MTATRLAFVATTRWCSPCGEISVATRAQFVRFAVNFQLHATLDHENKALRGRAAKFSARLELGRVFRELGAQCRTDMHNRGASLHSRQGGAHKSVWRQQQMIRLMGTSCLAKIMHGLSFSEIRTKRQADREDASRTRLPSLHPQPATDSAGSWLMPPGVRRKIIAAGTFSARIMAS